jgi:acetyltransferase
MTVRNLESTLSPKSVALVGASSREGSVGRVVLENVLGSGYAGRIYPVNPKYADVLGVRCYRQVPELPEAPDLAVIMTPPATVPELIDQLGARGTKAVVVVTAGVGIATGLRQTMLEAARPHMLRIIGPNTIGLLAPRVGLNASFTGSTPRRGNLGLISQSGAIVSSVVDWAAAEGIGFSQIYSLGDMADVDVGDCLNLLAQDDETAAILLYLEAIPQARKFMSAARAAARVKPVIAVKPGRHVEAARAAATHTGALAGVDRVIDAALRRAGIVRVDDLDDLFNAAEVMARFRPLEQARVAIVTNGGGAGVLAVDQLLDDDASLATLTPATLSVLDASLPTSWSHANPVDIIGDAPPERFAAALRAVAADPGVDVVLVMNCPTALADPVAAAIAVAGETEQGRISGKPVLACWLGKHTAEPARDVLQRSGIPNFDTPAQAAEGVAFLTRWSKVRSQLERVPPSLVETEADRDAVQAILAKVAAEGRTLLNEWEAKRVLAHYRVPVPETIFASTEAGVEVAAGKLLKEASSVVVKMASKSISHKSDIGGVALNLASAVAARAAADTIRQRFDVMFQGIPLDGFTVQPMVVRPGARELIAGLSTDPGFGPVVVFGAGGTSVEVVDDTATGLVPLDEVLAGDLIDRTRVGKVLAGYRDVPPANRNAIVATLVALSQLAIDFPTITSIDINPLLVDANGVIALDARIEIDAAHIAVPAPNPSAAIRPYPADQHSSLRLGELDLLLRPIRPTDAALYPRFLERMEPEDLRMRFLVPTRTLTQQTLIRLTQLDYDRDIAFVALEMISGALAGIVRYAADPDRTRAEFGVLVRSDLKHRGLGRAMMQRLIAYARSEGIGELGGLVLRENAEMLALCRELGFEITNFSGESTAVCVSLSLTDEVTAQAS